MTDRVEVPVHEYLANESSRMHQLAYAVACGMHPDTALRELLDSYATMLSIMAQQQLERDTRGNG